MIPTSLVGLSVEPIEHHVDERWTMAYAAALGDYLPTYLDTTKPKGIVAHPVFGVCPEWPVIVASRSQTLAHGVTPAEVLTSIHATHDTTIHRLIRPGDRLVTSLELVGMEQISPGAKSTMRLRTVDQLGHPVTTTTQDGIYLGLTATGAQHPDPERPPSLHADRIGEPIEVAVAIDPGAAHTYTECARIWNPIHTDKAVALASGLPDIILHGTANLAHGVSAVVEHRAYGSPELVRRITCRFAAMVMLPSTITVRVWPAIDAAETSAPGTSIVPFEVLNEQGHPAVKDGYVLLGRPAVSG